jgi:hypothetical protein
MFRRWLIRGLALALLTLCVVAWGGSFFEGIELGNLSGNVDRPIGAVWGVGWVRQTRGVYTSDRLFEYEFLSPRELRVWISKHTTSGFFIGDQPGQIKIPGLLESSMMAFPLWLPTLILAGLNCLVWRKTRPKFNGRGFPVEAAAKEAPHP